jgi:uncharacterized protein (TIGR02284 family)
MVRCSPEKNMSNSREQSDILLRAIQINNDRIAGYTKAMELIDDGQSNSLKGVFQDYIDQSEDFKSQLSQLLEQGDGEIQKDTLFTGKLFRLWMDLKAGLSPSTTQAVLELCEKGEEEFRDTYQDILSESHDVFPEIVHVLNLHLVEQNNAHIYIKELRGL